MTRRLTGLILILTILFSVLTTLSAVIGRGYDPPVVIALLYPGQPGSIVRAADRIAFFDLSRLLRITRVIPLKAAQQTSLNYPPDGNLTVSTYEMNVPKKIYKAGLYVYNYLWGTLTDVFTTQADQAFNIASTGYFYNFFPATSNNGERIVFIHPQDQRLYLYNTATKQTSPLGDFQLGVEDRGSVLTSGSDLINWSPDDSKIILKLASTLYIFNSDSGEYREHSFDTGDFYPTWSGDSQYLWLQRYSFATQNENTPIEIIDVSTGQEHPLTRDLSGTSLWWWGCEGRWLTYVVENETQREGYILNLQDGSTLRVNDVPLLADVSIGQISSLDDCKTFLITTESPNASNSMMRVVSSIRPTYLFDLPTRSAEYLGELSGMVWMTDDGDLYYQTQLPNTDIVQIFRRTIRPLGDPIFVKEITAADAMYVSWASDLSYATYMEASSSSYWRPVNYVDANSGRNYELTSPDEFVQTYAQTTWQALKSGRQPE